MSDIKCHKCGGYYPCEMHKYQGQCPECTGDADDVSVYPRIEWNDVTDMYVVRLGRDDLADLWKGIGYGLIISAVFWLIIIYGIICAMN
jgi:hypothetical protein